MGESLLINPRDPFRPPDWRWQVAQYLKSKKQRATRSSGLTNVEKAKEFLIALERASTLQQKYDLLYREPALYGAWSIYNFQGALFHARLELESRLLASQPCRAIEVRMGLTQPVVDTYATVFFDVADRLDNPSAIIHAVIQPSLAGGLSERNSGALWKLFGYSCGADMLDLLIYRFTGRQQPSSPSEVSAFMADDIRQHVRLKALIAIATMPINWQTQTEIMNLHQRMTEFAANMGGDGANDSMKEGIQSLLESLPWTRSASEARAKGLTDDLEKGGVGLRADEMLLRAAGQSPDGLEELVASAKYPPRERKTTVSQ